MPLINWSANMMVNINLFVSCDDLVSYFLLFQGGFDMICSGRDKIETPEQVPFDSTHMHTVPRKAFMLKLTEAVLSHFSLNKLKKQQLSLI